jgi:hypothetical protein
MAASTRLRRSGNPSSSAVVRAGQTAVIAVGFGFLLGSGMIA